MTRGEKIEVALGFAIALLYALVVGVLSSALLLVVILAWRSIL